MKTFEEIAKSLSAEYSLRTREIRVFRERNLVTFDLVPESEESDYWLGEVIEGINVDFNLCKSEDDFSYSLCVYPVIDGKTQTGKYIEVPLSLLNTYWSVVTHTNDRGSSTRRIMGFEDGKEKPKKWHHHFSHVDSYMDYFDTEQEALQFVAQSKNA